MSLSEDTAKDIRDIGDAVERLKQLLLEDGRAREEQARRQADIEYQLGVIAYRQSRLARQTDTGEREMDFKRARMSVRTPYVNSMTSEIMYPEDCTCKFSGSCLAYCNPYK
jgi:hypothetical protein